MGAVGHARERWAIAEFAAWRRVLPALMRRDVEVGDAASVMPEHQEDVEHAERDRRDRKEVDGHDLANVVPQERAPVLRWRLGLAHNGRPWTRPRRGPEEPARIGSSVLPRWDMSVEFSPEDVEIHRGILRKRAEGGQWIVSTTDGCRLACTGRQSLVRAGNILCGRRDEIESRQVTGGSVPPVLLLFRPLLSAEVSCFGSWCS